MMDGGRGRSFWNRTPAEDATQSHFDERGASAKHLTHPFAGFILIFMVFLVGPVTSRRRRWVTEWREVDVRADARFGRDVRPARTHRAGRSASPGRPADAPPPPPARLHRPVPRPRHSGPRGPVGRGAGIATGGVAADGRLPETSADAVPPVAAQDGLRADAQPAPRPPPGPPLGEAGTGAARPLVDAAGPAAARRTHAQRTDGSAGAGRARQPGGGPSGRGRP